MIRDTVQWRERKMLTILNENSRTNTHIKKRTRATAAQTRTSKSGHGRRRTMVGSSKSEPPDRQSEPPDLEGLGVSEGNIAVRASNTHVADPAGGASGSSMFVRLPIHTVRTRFRVVGRAPCALRVGEPITPSSRRVKL
jgi:hypothetical protein